jgi:hypothetical protein
LICDIPALRQRRWPGDAGSDERGAAVRPARRVLCHERSETYGENQCRDSPVYLVRHGQSEWNVLRLTGRTDLPPAADVFRARASRTSRIPLRAGRPCGRKWGTAIGTSSSGEPQRAARPAEDPLAATACRDRRFGVRSASQHARRTAHRREFDLFVRSDYRSQVRSNKLSAVRVGRPPRSVVTLGADFFDGALWARFESRRVTERYRCDGSPCAINPQVSG